MTSTDPAPAGEGLTAQPTPAAQVPPAALLAQLASLVREVAASADRSIAEVVAFLHRNKL